MIVESIQRFVHPTTIHFGEALPVAVLGLVVDLVSAKRLDHDDDHDDHGTRAARLHVVADALTSVLAIGALVPGRFVGWTFLDPAMGIVGALVVLHRARA
jgi:Co/Zn/Cd efflux system component